MALPEKLFKADDELKVGSYTFKVIHVPGHSRSDSCFYCKEENVIFTGDVLFSRSIGRTDLPEGNPIELIENIHMKLMTLPENTKIYAGHGEQSSIGAEKRENPFL